MWQRWFQRIGQVSWTETFQLKLKIKHTFEFLSRKIATESDGIESNDKSPTVYSLLQKQTRKKSGKSNCRRFCRFFWSRNHSRAVCIVWYRLLYVHCSWCFFFPFVFCVNNGKCKMCHFLTLFMNVHCSANIREQRKKRSKFKRNRYWK